MKDHSWLLAKKRGNHRTDSQLLGIITEFSFAAFCVLAGLIGLIWLCVFFVFPEWKIHERYEKTICTLVDCRISPRTVLNDKPINQDVDIPSIFEDSEGIAPIDDGNVSIVTPQNTETEDSLFTRFDVNSLRANLQEIYYLPEMQLKYRVDGVERTNWTSSFGSITRSSRFPTPESAQEFLEKWQKEKHYYCLFNPQNPDEVVIMRDWQLENFFALIIPSSLLLLGIAIGIHALTAPRFGGSKEKKAAQHIPPKCPESIIFPKKNMPGIPPFDEILDSQGSQLPYRLRMIDSPIWTLLILAIVSLAWNAGCITFLTITACTFLQKLEDWLMLLYLLPFLGIGIWLLSHTYIQLRNAAAAGQTIAEISQFPLLPGKQVCLYLSQGGMKKLQWFNVILVCEEEAVFTHGTNTRREKQRVYQKQIFGEEALELANGQPFEIDLPLEIPHDAMHTFVSPHNQINWRIIVQGKSGKYPMFERSFPLTVCPELPEVK